MTTDQEEYDLNVMAQHAAEAMANPAMQKSMKALEARSIEAMLRADANKPGDVLKAQCMVAAIRELASELKGYKRTQDLKAAQKKSVFTPPKDDDMVGEV